MKCIECGTPITRGAKRYCRPCNYKNATRTADEKLIPIIEERIGESIVTFLRRRYLTEQATFRELNIEMGLGDNARRLKRWMTLAGVKPRGKSEAVRLQHERNPNRGRQWALWLSSDEARRRMAKSRQSNANLSALQMAALALARELGLDAVPEYAVEFYNIDLAFPGQMVAIELNGGNWHTEAKDGERDAALIALGWTVHRIQAQGFGKLLRLLESLA